MAKHKIKGFVYWLHNSWDTEPKLDFNHYDSLKSSEHTNRALIGPAEFEFEVPDTFEPNAVIVKDLEELKQRHRAKLAAAIFKIDDRIANLLMIPGPKKTAEIERGLAQGDDFPF